MRPSTLSRWEAAAVPCVRAWSCVPPVKSAVILEKTDLVGGTTARAGGVMWIPNNPFMRRDGIEDSSDKALTYLDAVIGDASDAPGATPARRRSLCERSAAHGRVSRRPGRQIDARLLLAGLLRRAAGRLGAGPHGRRRAVRCERARRLESQAAAQLFSCCPRCSRTS